MQCVLHNLPSLLCGLHWHRPYLCSKHGVFRVDPISSVEVRHVLQCVCVFTCCINIKIILVFGYSARMESMHVSLILIGGGNLFISDGCFHVVSVFSFMYVYFSTRYFCLVSKDGYVAFFSYQLGYIDSYG